MRRSKETTSRVIDDAIRREDPLRAIVGGLLLGLDLEDEWGTDGAIGWREAMRTSADPHALACLALQGGIEFMNHGDRRSARSLFRTAMEINDQEASPRAAIGLGWILEDAGEPGDAISAFTYALKAKKLPWEGKVALRLGWLLQDAGRYEEAEAAFTRASRSKDKQIALKGTVGLGSIFAERYAMDLAETYFIEAEVMARNLRDAELVDAVRGLWKTYREFEASTRGS